MNRSVFRTALLYAGLAGGFILLDLVVDRLFSEDTQFLWPHVFIAAVAVLVSYAVLSMALETRRRADAVLRQSRDELAIRVRERTADLERSNAALQAEIAERIRVGDALGASEATARALINALTESALLMDTHGVLLAANETAAQRLLARRERLLGSSFFSYFSPDVATRRRSYLEQVLQTRQPACFEDEVEGRSFDIYVHPICDAEDNVIRLAVFDEDVTERKRAEEALSASEERYRTLFDNFPEPTTVWDRNGVLLMQNVISARNLGGRRDDYLGKTIYNIFGDVAAGYLERMVRVIDTGITENRQDVVELPSGRRYFWTCMQRVQSPLAGNAVQIISYDTTDRKRAEEALSSSEERFATVFHFSPDAIGIVRIADGTLLEVNEAFTKVLGYTWSEVAGRAWTELGLITEPAEGDKLAERFLQNGELAGYEIELVTREGSVATMLISLTPIAVSGERCVLAIGHDITLRKRSEEALRRGQEELALGLRERAMLEERQRLARELHDSVSQALYGISLGAHTALTLFDSDQPRVLEALHYVLSLAQAGLTEMRALIFELRPESLEMEGLVVALTKQTAATRASHSIEVEVSLCDEPEVPLAVKEALYRIAQEALQNAVKHARPARLEVHLSCNADVLELEVCDDGMGFDPLAQYPGHLGLRSMRERAVGAGGTLEIVSAPQRGTQIHARIPVSSTESA